MVFSFFKKQIQKKPERQAVKPEPPKDPVRAEAAPKPKVVKQTSDVKPELKPTSPPNNNLKPSPASPSLSSGPMTKRGPDSKIDDVFGRDFDLRFMDSNVMGIDVELDTDPLQTDVEHAVVLFANGKDSAARVLLESLISVYPGIEGKRLWLLLLDLLQILDDRAAFDKQSLAFAEICETSPPSWRQAEEVKVELPGRPKSVLLQGVLADMADPALQEIAKFISEQTAIRIDCSKLVSVDDEVAAWLAKKLSSARRNGVSVALAEIDGFLDRLNDRLQVGEAAHLGSWSLLLELMQRHRSQEAFEERAVDYAVTFELSPPSWEERAQLEDIPELEPILDDAYYLSGDLKNCRFDELVPFLEMNDHPIIDFSGVHRMDFFSAGQLVNRITVCKEAGKEVLVRSPNYLIAELMAVVGLNKQARIIVPRQ